jgi:hypothetical protein
MLKIPSPYDATARDTSDYRLLSTGSLKKAGDYHLKFTIDNVELP